MCNQHKDTCWVSNPNAIQTQSSGKSLWPQQVLDILLYKKQTSSRTEAGSWNRNSHPKKEGKRANLEDKLMHSRFLLTGKCWTSKMRGGGQCLEQLCAPMVWQEQPSLKTRQNQINSTRTTLRKKAGGVLLDKVLAERIEIACRESVSYCLIPLLFKETEFCTFFVHKRAASKYLGDQFCLLLETIRWA